MSEQDDSRDADARGAAGSSPPFSLATLHRLIDLRTLCTSVLERLDARASARHVSLESAQFASGAWGDDGVLQAVLIELLDHCIGRVLPGSTLTLMTTPRRRATELRVVIWDGHPRGDTMRTVRATSEPQPVDLQHALGHCGLAIAASGGTMWVEHANTGSALCVRLPNAR